MKRYACWIYCIVSNYTDYVMASSAADARKIYAEKRGCSQSHVEVRPA